MRIACLHLPQFALQCVTRIDPALRGAAVAVVGAGHDPAAGTVSRVALHSPVVQACSRAAWSLGVRVGMTATAARAASPEIRIITADAALERETVRALADALLSATPVVDVGGRVGAGGAHLAMYCEVPSKTRGTSFGDRLLQKLESLGITGRIGIADDRFTAWVAAWNANHGSDDDASVVSVPRGGSAAFLAPLPLSLLSISPEVQHMLEALGVRTLGAFAALPAPSVTRPLEADYQALARGDSGQTLRPYAPEAPIREEMVIGKAANAPSAPAAVALLAERVALRLAGRARGAARLEIVASGEDGERIVPITPLSVSRALLSTGEELAEAIGSVLHDGHPWRLKVSVVGEAIAGDDTVNTLADDLERVDALSLVLSTTGAVDLAFGLSFGSTSPGMGRIGSRDERREPYRRTRRGKQQRRRVADTAADLVQPRLFKL
ncbi:MAG: hypothetical protein WKG01_42195 [Kofleriaceae bacterium]